MVTRESNEVNELIAELPSDIQQIVSRLREVIFQASPELKEEVKWSKPSYSQQGLVCYLAPAKKHVNLGFYKGSELKDEGAVLQGTGKQMRHIQVKKLEQINEELFVSLIQEAIELNK